MNIDYSLTVISSSVSTSQCAISICQLMAKAIIWTNDGLEKRCKYASIATCIQCITYKTIGYIYAFIGDYIYNYICVCVWFERFKWKNVTASYPLKCLAAKIYCKIVYHRSDLRKLHNCCICSRDAGLFYSKKRAKQVLRAIGVRRRQCNRLWIFCGDYAFRVFDRHPRGKRDIVGDQSKVELLPPMCTKTFIYDIL